MTYSEGEKMERSILVWRMGAPLFDLTWDHTIIMSVQYIAVCLELLYNNATDNS